MTKSTTFKGSAPSSFPWPQWRSCPGDSAPTCEVPTGVGGPQREPSWKHLSTSRECDPIVLDPHSNPGGFDMLEQLQNHGCFVVLGVYKLQFLLKLERSVNDGSACEIKVFPIITRNCPMHSSAEQQWTKTSESHKGQHRGLRKRMDPRCTSLPRVWETGQSNVSVSSH